MRSAHKQKNPTISNVKSLDLWSSRAGQIRTFSFHPISGQSVLKTDGLGAILVVERNQQRDRCVLLILDIHDQLNDLVDHHIVLNQLHGLPDDQIFQPVLLHGLFVAALTPLDVGAYLYFFSKCFTILRILARAVSFFCRSITLALLNFCVSSHLHCSVRLTQVELSANTANTTGSSGNRAARCVRL